MLGAFATNVLDSKVVHDKGESNTEGVMLPERWCAGDGGVSVIGKVVLVAITGKLPCLIEPGYPLADLHVDVSVLG